LTKQVIQRTIHLSYNAFGNYVIQFLLKNNGKYRHEIITEIYQHFLKLSINKYGSNVVEKCISFADDEQHELFLNYILCIKGKKHAPIIEMIKNEFGNYVVQKMIDLSNEEQLRRIHNYTSARKLRLGSYPFGKYIRSRLKKILKQKELSGLKQKELPN